MPFKRPPSLFDFGHFTYLYGITSPRLLDTLEHKLLDLCNYLDQSQNSSEMSADQLLCDWMKKLQKFEIYGNHRLIQLPTVNRKDHFDCGVLDSLVSSFQSVFGVLSVYSFGSKKEQWVSVTCDSLKNFVCDQGSNPRPLLLSQKLKYGCNTK